MIAKITLILAAALLLAAILAVNLFVMSGDMPPAEVMATLWRGRQL